MIETNSKYCMGVLALVWSTISLAATVNMTPSASAVANGTAFNVILSAVDMPENGGASLSLRFDHTKVTVDSIQPCTVVLCGAVFPFDFLSTIASVGLDQKDFTFSISGSNTLPAGSSFSVVRINFTAAASGSGPANIQIVDDGAAYCWGNPNTFGCYTGINYLQANVQIVPAPPAAFLLPSALAALGWVKRRRRGIP